MYRDSNQEETEKSELSWGLENGRAGLDTSRWFWKPLQVLAVSWQFHGSFTTVSWQFHIRGSFMADT